MLKQDEDWDAAFNKRRKRYEVTMIANETKGEV